MTGRAPRRPAEKAATAATATADAAGGAGAAGDLPKSIGGPATRALVNAGITTLAQVARLGDAELLAMHGVGPKAVRLLRELQARQTLPSTRGRRAPSTATQMP